MARSSLPPCPRPQRGASTALALALLLGACDRADFVPCSETATCPQDASSGGSPATGGEGGTSACAEECDGATPLCDVETGTCVACTTESDCDEGLCDTTAEPPQCVACLEDSDCNDPDAARCDNGECKPCTNSDHCAGVAEGEVCDDDSGTCVECTPTDESPCGDNSCNPASLQCTQTERGSKTRCQSCLADSECQDDYRCVPMDFQGQNRDGGYCLKVLDTGCSRPLMVPTPARVSLSGADPVVYCGVSESRTTCEAVLNLLADTECPGGTNDACGAPGLDDARCETVNGGANRCTYSCDAANQCPNTFSCGNDPNDYCGAVQ